VGVTQQQVQDALAKVATPRGVALTNANVLSAITAGDGGVGRIDRGNFAEDTGAVLQIRKLRHGHAEVFVVGGVLVVEDEDRMRAFVEEAFRELGFDVVSASNGLAGLRLMDSHEDIALLFTDVVMPDMNGRRLAEEAQRRKPSLRVIFTTGFSRNAVIHNGVLDKDVNFLAKPFTFEQLTAKVREVMGS